MLQYIGSRTDPIQKSNDADAVFHHAGIIAHADTANARHSGKQLLKLPDM